MIIGYVISTDESGLDVPVTHDYLSNRSYGGQGGTMGMVLKRIGNSLCCGSDIRPGAHIFWEARRIWDGVEAAPQKALTSIAACVF